MIFRFFWPAEFTKIGKWLVLAAPTIFFQSEKSSGQIYGWIRWFWVDFLCLVLFGSRFTSFLSRIHFRWDSMQNRGWARTASPQIIRIVSKAKIHHAPASKCQECYQEWSQHPKWKNSDLKLVTFWARIWRDPCTSAPLSFSEFVGAYESLWFLKTSGCQLSEKYKFVGAIINLGCSPKHLPIFAKSMTDFGSKSCLNCQNFDLL